MKWMNHWLNNYIYKYNEYLNDLLRYKIFSLSRFGLGFGAIWYNRLVTHLLVRHVFWLVEVSISGENTMSVVQNIIEKECRTYYLIIWQKTENVFNFYF